MGISFIQSLSLAMVQQEQEQPPKAQNTAVLAVEQLVEEAQQGDRDAMGKILRQASRDVTPLCIHMVGPNDGLDIAQITLSKIFRKLHLYDKNKGAFRTWVLSVARNACLDRLRRKQIERRVFLKDSEKALQYASEPKANRLVAKLDAKRSVSKLRAALAELPDGQRDAVIMFHANGASYEEIAEALSVPKGTVMTWLHRGRKKLRKLVISEEVQ